MIRSFAHGFDVSAFSIEVRQESVAAAAAVVVSFAPRVPHPLFLADISRLQLYCRYRGRYFVIVRVQLGMRKEK